MMGGAQRDEEFAAFEQHAGHIVRSRNGAAQADVLAADIAAALTRAVEHRGRARIAFSGGSTPAAMLRQLAAQPVDWARVDVTLVDERCVDAEDERSNARLLHSTLFAPLVTQPAFFPLYVSGEDESGRDARFAQFALPFDVVHLGMGEDAHTASFFPDAPNIAAMLDPEEPRRIVTTQSPSSRERRLTWSLAALLRSRRIVLQVSGSRKRDVLAQVLSTLAGGPVATEACLRLPVLAVLARTSIASPDGIPARIYFADE